MLSLLQQLPAVARADLCITFAATYAVPAVTVVGAIPPAAVAVGRAVAAPTVARGDLGAVLVAANAFPAVTVFLLFFLMLSLLQELFLLLLLL